MWSRLAGRDRLRQQIAVGYRRSKESAHKARDWRRFVRENAALLVQSGVPAFIYESLDLWGDLLMHGYIDHHEDPSGFHIRALSEQLREKLVECVALFLADGWWEDVPADADPRAEARKILFGSRIVSTERCK